MWNFLSDLRILLTHGMNTPKKLKMKKIFVEKNRGLNILNDSNLKWSNKKKSAYIFIILDVIFTLFLKWNACIWYFLEFIWWWHFILIAKYCVILCYFFWALIFIFLNTFFEIPIESIVKQKVKNTQKSCQEKK